MQDTPLETGRASWSAGRVVARVVTVVAIVAVIVAVTVKLVQYFGATKRPPIIVKGGSIHFENVDLTDGTGTVVVPRRTWSKDLGGNEYKPDQFLGPSIDGFEVYDRKERKGCGSGKRVTVTYEEDGVEHAFHLKPKRWIKLFQYEPKLEVLGNEVLTRDQPGFVLSYGTPRKGTIKIEAGSDSCTQPVADADFEIRMVAE